MKRQGSARREHGKGSLIVRYGSWYGQWRVGGRLVKRKLGEQRSSRNKSGLTKPQAERALARSMQEVKAAPLASAPQTFREIGEAHLNHLEHVRDLKPTTISDYRSILRHWDAYFGTRVVRRLKPEDFTAYMKLKSAQGLSRKTVRNHITFAGGCLGFAVKRGWLQSNPVDLVDRLRVRHRGSDIRYLTVDEVQRVRAAVPDDLLGPTDRAVYSTATMSGLRQGELIALRWMDVDLGAGVIRVRQSITRGKLGPPKSRRGIRAVPIAGSLATELMGHLRRTSYAGDEDYVFCHPETGRPYDASRQRKRFKAAVAAAELRPVRFHDLRHTFGTRMAAVGVPMRTLQEWMGHGSIETTQIYADYAPNPVGERAWAEHAFEDLGGEADAA